MIHLSFDGDGEVFRHAMAGHRASIQATEGYFQSQQAVTGYCNVCGSVQALTISAGPDFGEGRPNLREGLVCPCGAKHRDRLMVMASQARLLAADRTLFFGALSGWADWARRARPDATVFCEYMADETTRGQEVLLPHTDLRVMNEDLTRLSFADASADLVVHQDVLEHIPDYRAALRETLRVLRPGGATVFTAPFFDVYDVGLTRAALRDDGSIEHFLPEERHGDPLSPEGILAFYNFGWDLLAAMREEGFQDVSATIIYAPDLGVVSNGCPTPDGNMLPIYIAGVRPA